MGTLGQKLKIKFNNGRLPVRGWTGQPVQILKKYFIGGTRDRDCPVHPWTGKRLLLNIYF